MNHGKISIVSPAFNEEESIGFFLTEVKKVLKKVPWEWEIILVDDGSVDGTRQQIKTWAEKDKRIKYIGLAKNSGQQAAIIAGLRNAHGDANILMDCDLQDPPRYIPDMVKEWEKGAGIVFACRASREDKLFKKLTAFIFYRMANILGKRRLEVDCGDFYLLSKDATKQVVAHNTSGLFLRGIIANLSLKSTKILIEREKRHKGRTKYTLLKMVKLSWDALIFLLKREKTLSKQPFEIAERINFQKGRVAIIGGGISGLSCGYFLSRKGYQVTIFEKEKEIGGLLSTFKLGNKWLEKYYHHAFPKDEALINLLEKLKLSEELGWYGSKMSVLLKGKMVPFYLPWHVFRILSFFKAIRLMVGTMLLSVRGIKGSESKTAQEIIEKYMGKAGWREFWGILHQKKFGTQSGSVSAAWFLARLKSRVGARKGQGELLGYPGNSFKVVIDSLIKEVRGRRGELRREAEVSIVRPSGQQFKIRRETFDYVVFTIPPHLVRQIMPEISREIPAIKYLGNVSVLLELKKSFSQAYWINNLQMELSFSALIEQTNLVPFNYGSSLLYVTCYTENEGKLYRSGNQEIVDDIVGELEKVSPGVGMNIKKATVFKTPYAQPIVTKGYRIPPRKFKMQNVYSTSMAHIFPDDRGMNQAVSEAETIAAFFE